MSISQYYNLNRHDRLEPPQTGTIAARRFRHPHGTRHG